MLMGQEGGLPDFNDILQDRPDLINKTSETEEDINVKLQKCIAEVQEALQKYNCFITINPTLYVDNKGKILYTPQVALGLKNT